MADKHSPMSAGRPSMAERAARVEDRLKTDPDLLVFIGSNTAGHCFKHLSSDYQSSPIPQAAIARQALAVADRIAVIRTLLDSPADERSAQDNIILAGLEGTIGKHDQLMALREQDG